MPWDEGKLVAPQRKGALVEPDALSEERERRHAARRFFRAAPPYRIAFDDAGKAVLGEKFYEYWPNLEPEAATTWRAISRHDNLEEAERRLRLICGGPVFYDAEGRVASAAPHHKPRWEMPPADDE